MKESTMSITRAQLREMILKEASFDPDRRTSDDEDKFARMNWSYDVATDEDSLRDAFEELTGVRPTNIGLIVKIWNEDNLGEDVNMYDWLLALLDRKNVSIYAADFNALQRALNNRQAAAEVPELKDLKPTEYDYEIDYKIDQQRQDESTIMTVGQFRKLIREVASVKDVNDHTDTNNEISNDVLESKIEKAINKLIK